MQGFFSKSFLLTGSRLKSAPPHACVFRLQTINSHRLDFTSLATAACPMGLLDFLRPRFQLTLANCATHAVSFSESFPATLSRKTASGETSPYCKITRTRDGYAIEPTQNNTPLFLDALPLKTSTLLEPNRCYGLAVTEHLMLIRIQRGQPSLPSDFSSLEWDIVPIDKPQSRETISTDTASRRELEQTYLPASQYLAYPTSAAACFRFEDFLHLWPETEKTSPPTAKVATPARATITPSTAPPRANVHICPSCWLAFPPEEALNIATHDELTGDPILGPHAKLRFPAERFNERGQALDPKGSTSLDLACPHCRGRLPHGFFDRPQNIVSLVGAPSSGKSYYLSVLLKRLPEELLAHFDLHLQDGDPSANARLNEMKNRLFAATSPADAFISKTDFEGVMYDHLQRDGKLVALPSPFTYHLQELTPAANSPAQRSALVFYDNAGEHFKPGISLEDSPGALHVTASTALLFLFDPSTHPAFRRRLARKRDPQLRSTAIEEQDVILAEMGVRIKKTRNLASHERIQTPLALIVGKFDLWRDLLPEGAISLPESNRPLAIEELESNSRATRQLLLELCPTLVANAESISHNVRYFPVSSLGHSPKEIPEGPLAGKIAPNPKRLQPLLATSPVIWALGLTPKNRTPNRETDATANSQRHLLA